jgi:putative holliday junction resolvase
MRLMALDVGKKRIGIAISDPLKITARPHSTIDRGKSAYPRIVSLVQELEVERIIVGLPLHLSGVEGEQAKDVRSFVAKLQPHLNIPIEYKDERLTTVEAEYRIADRRGDWRKRKSKIDAVAASVLLEEYLKER